MITFKIKKSAVECNFTTVTISDDEPLAIRLEGCEENYKYRIVATINGKNHAVSANSAGLATLPATFFESAGAGRMALDMQRWDSNGQVMYERYNLPTVDVLRPAQGGWEMLNLVNDMEAKYNDLRKKCEEQHAKLTAVIFALGDIGVALELTDEGE